MNKKPYPMIGIVVAAVVIGIIVVTISDENPGQGTDDSVSKPHDSVWSGPIGVTQYEHKLGENVYFMVRGLQPNEKGAIGIFTPQGVLYSSFEYDGSKKSDFNQYFFPDTSEFLEVCTPEELVGVWNVVFADKSYPPLQFEMTDEWIRSGENTIFVEC